MEKRFNSSNALAPVILVILGALVIGCGGKLEGTTYAGNGESFKLNSNQVAKRTSRPGRFQLPVPIQRAERPSR